MTESKTEYLNGCWQAATEKEPEGKVVYSCGPTGRPVWTWWVRPQGVLAPWALLGYAGLRLAGLMGEASTIDEARACVESEIRRQGR